MSSQDPIDIPQIPVLPARRSFWDRVSIIWLIPVAALAVALGVAWQSFANRGPLIEINFADASGIVPRETELRFRNVPVGLVEDLGFTDDLDQVVVKVRMHPDVADYVDGDAAFWVVRPQVSAQGITGLETVLSGVYIQGQWDVAPGGLVRRFDGLAQAPLMSADELGTTVVLRATDGGLQGDVPLLYKGIEVGRVGPATVTPDGFAVEAQAVVLEPWDNMLTETTRFYNASGFSISLGAGGAAVNFDSIASLLVGGVSFETWVSGAPLAREGASYTVYPDSDTARSSIFNRPDGPPLMLSAVFEGNVTGLTLGAPVEIDGLRIGEVSGMTGLVDRAAFGDGRVRLLTQLTIQPSRLGFDGDDGPAEALAFLQDQVAEGMRARMTTSSILTGGLKVQITTLAGMDPGGIDLDALPYPALPVAPSDIADIQATAQGTLDRLNALPIEDLMSSAAQFLDGAARLVASDDVQATPGDIRRVIASIEAVTTSDGVQAVPARIDQALAALVEILTEARALVATLNSADAANRILATVDSAGATLDEARTAIAGLPQLIETIEGFVAEASALGLVEIAAEAQGLLAEARALVAAPATQGLPGQLSATVSEATAILAELRASGLIDNVGAAVADFRALAADLSAAAAPLPDLVSQAEGVMTSIDAATAGLPGLIANADAVAANLAAADIDAIAAEAGALIASVDRWIATPEVQALPGRLNGLLAETTTLAADLNAAGVGQAVGAAVASIESASDRVAAATEGLPALVDRANQTLGSANTALEGLSDVGQALRDVRSALREISRAADSVASLARLLERNPNSLIFGR